MNEVYDFIDFHNQTRATIERLLRFVETEWKGKKHQLYHCKVIYAKHLSTSFASLSAYSCYILCAETHLMPCFSAHKMVLLYAERMGTYEKI